MRAKAFTLLEMLVSMAIFLTIAGLIYSFQRSVLRFNADVQDALSAQADTLKVLNVWTNELRAAETAENGAFSIAEAGTSSLAFYSDIDDDNVTERVRYSYANGKLRRGVIEPTGNPPVYVAGNEVVRDQIRDVVASATTIFQYYGSSYDGSSAALSQPVNVQNIRLVKILVYIDRDPARAPSAIEVGTQVSIRNLKDNL